MTKHTIITATDRQIDLATDWHGGMHSMLYAVASTGALSRGNIAPFGVDTEVEWDQILVGYLASELDGVIAACFGDEELADDLTVASEWREQIAPVLAALDEQVDALDLD